MKRGFGATQTWNIRVGGAGGIDYQDSGSGQSFNFFGDAPPPRSALPSGAIVNHFGSVGTVFTKQNNKTFINGVEVPEGTSLLAGKPFYQGEAVTRANEKLLERFPSFALLLDSMGVKKAKAAKPFVPAEWKDEPERASRHKCDLCHKRGISTVCVPCRCAVLCTKCAIGTAAIKECRACKKPLKRIERIYFAR